MAVNFRAIKKLLSPLYELDEYNNIKLSKKDIPEKYKFLLDYIWAQKMTIRKVGDLSKIFKEDVLHEGKLSDYGSYTKFDGWILDLFGKYTSSTGKKQVGKVASYVVEDTFGFRNAARDLDTFNRNELKNHIEAHKKTKLKG